MTKIFSCCFCSSAARARRRTVPVDSNSGSRKGSTKSAESGEEVLASVPVGTENLLDIEKECPVLLDTRPWMDELRERANVRFLQHIEAPSTERLVPQTIPDMSLVLEHVYGYSSTAQRGNMQYLYPPSATGVGGTVVYPAGNRVVISPGFGIPSAPPEKPNGTVGRSSVTSLAQRNSGGGPQLFASHVRAVTAVAVHPSEPGVFASVELGPAPVVKIWAVRSNAAGANSPAVATPGGRKRIKSYAAPSFSSAGVMPAGDGTLEVVTLAVVTLPADVLHVPGLAFAKDGTVLTAAANRANDAEVLIYDWRRMDICESDTPAPLARAFCPTHLFNISASPWGRREFVTTGASHLAFWMLDTPLLSGGPSLLRRDAIGKESEKGDDAAVPTVLCSTFTRSRGVLATGGLNGDVTFWKGERVEACCRSIHKGPVLSMALLPHTELSFLSGGADARILVWNDAHQPVSEITLETSQPTPIRSLDAGSLGGAWSGWGEQLKRRASRAFGMGGVPPIDTGETGRAARSSSTKKAGSGVEAALVCVGGGDGSIWAVDVKSDGKISKTLVAESHADGVKTPLWGLAPHPRDPNLVLTAGHDGLVRLWNAQTKKLVAKRDLGAKLRCCGWEPNGKAVAVGTDDGTVHVLTSEIQGTVIVITQRRDAIHDVKFSPTGRHLAVATHESVIDVYVVDGQEGPYQRTMCCRGHSSYVVSVDWSRDGLRLQSNSGNSEIMFWTMTVTPAPPPMKFSEVDWATTTCPLTWASKGVYNTGAVALAARLGGDLDAAARKTWLRKLLASKEHRTSMFEINGCVLGLRDVTCAARGIPADKSSPHPLLLLGTVRGDVHMMRYPAFHEGSLAYTWTPHAGPVGRVAFSCDGRTVFSVGALDGCLVQHKMVDHAVELKTMPPISAEIWNAKSLAQLP
ncbi:WD40-repeat-containing domain protein [Geranomyces variabilis]|nr:WD40-repeat-containing domain protein [Geranomyces variabilis]KAJ3141780.1 Echinoderm microtubule-associated protein-like 2 [Geranomyces variabilis]